VRDAQFAEAVAVGQIGHRVHLVEVHVARRDAGGLQREHDRAVAGALVRAHVAFDPAAKAARRRWWASSAGIVGRQGA
jgi:hypothetical protein